MSRFLILLVCTATLTISGSAEAQRNVRRTPGFVDKPTLSPYVNLFRANNGGLNSYFSFVRPQLEAEQFMRETAQQTAMNRALVRQESLQLQQALDGSTPRMTSLQQRPTSTGGIRRPAGRFMSYGTFYPSSGSVSRR